MKNLHIIPTDKPSRLFKVSDELKLTRKFDFYNGAIYQNIYITSDEKIKVGDWVIEFQKGDNIGEVHFINSEYVIANDIQKKIIITTDIDLIKDSVQAIDDEFLEWFVNNPSCEEIQTIRVSTWCNDGKVCVCNVPKFCNDKRNDFKYKIIIPNDESKQETHICKYCKAETTQSDDECYAKPKQETLEEAASRLYPAEWDWKEKESFIEGAQWQQEKMYSEEEMLQALNIGFTSTDETWEECVEFTKEQFKKK